MSTDYASVNVKCPFYISEDSKAIHCEGLEKGSRIAVEFRGKQYRENVKEKYCNGDFEKCKLYKTINQKYE